MPLEGPPDLLEAYRFGRFEVRLRNNILLRDGQRANIQQLPFRLLLALLESAGSVVSQEQLREKLWHGKNFADFDSGLRVAVRKLRAVLSDDASKPLYIQTVSGQGYQFIGDVIGVPSASSLQMAEAPLPIPAVDLIGAPSTTTTADALRPVRRWRLVAAVIAFAAFVALAIGRTVITYAHRRLLNPEDRVVNGGFIGNAGSDDTGRTLGPALQVKLEESPYLNLISEAEFRRIVSDSSSVSLADELRACTSLGGQVLVQGRVLHRGERFSIELSAWRCDSGKRLTTQSVDADSQASLISALDQAAANMRRRLGESNTSLQRFNAPLSEATTGSLAALRAFNLGEEKHDRGLESESIPYFRLATLLDPQFALAYAKLGAVYDNLGDASESRTNSQKAFDLRSRTTDREQLYIAARYYASVTGQVDDSIHTYEVWQSVYTHDFVPVNNLAVLYLALGRPDRTVELALRAIQLDPGKELSYGTLALAYLESGDLSDVAALCRNPTRAKAAGFWFHQTCLRADFASHDERAVQSEIAWAEGTSQESRILDTVATIAFDRGQLEKSHRLFEAGIANAISHHMEDIAALIELDEANFDSEIGKTAQARQEASRALSIVQAPTDKAIAALVFAKAGDAARTDQIVQAIAAQSSTDTLLNLAMLPAISGSLALSKNSPKHAIDVLERARPYDGYLRLGLAPGYYRGMAYLRNHQPAEAAKEFQSVIDHSTLSPESPYIVLSQLGLGRAVQLEGNISGATRIFGSLDSIWKNSDRDFPPLKELRRYQSEVMVQNRPPRRSFPPST